MRRPVGEHYGGIGLLAPGRAEGRRWAMAGANEQTVRIDYLTANWNPHADDGAGFELLVVTEDEQRHTLPVTATDLAALGSLLAHDPVLRFDPRARTLIIGNLVGQRVPAGVALPPPAAARAARAGFGPKRTGARKTPPAPDDPILFELGDS